MLTLTKSPLRRPCTSCNKMFTPTGNQCRVCNTCCNKSKTTNQELRKQRMLTFSKTFCRKCGIYFQPTEWQQTCPDCIKGKIQVKKTKRSINPGELKTILDRSSKFKLKVDDTYQIML
jgi:hypothetical protein